MVGVAKIAPRGFDPPQIGGRNMSLTKAKQMIIIPIIVITFFLLPQSLFCFLEANIAFASSHQITISKVKIKIEDELYIWEDRSKIPEKEKDGKTAPSTIVSFLDFAPGDKITPEKLDKKTQIATRRLINSNYFFDVQVMVIPPRLKPEYRTVLIRIKEGFLWRFGNLFVGKENLWGRRKSVLIFGGYNLAGGQYRDENFMGKAILLGGSLYYRRGATTVADYHQGQLNLMTGYFFTPVLLMGVNLKSRYTRFTEHSSDVTEAYLGGLKRTDLILSPYLNYQIQSSSATISLEGKIDAFPPLESDSLLLSYSSVIAARWHFLPKHPLFKEHSLNVQLSTGGANDSLPYLEKFDIYDTPDMSIRAGYPDMDLLLDRFVLINSEYRFPLLQFVIPPFFHTRITGFLYADVGFGGNEEDEKYFPRSYEGYGAGLRILFENPVFTYFSLSYGGNRDGDTRFVFTATPGFLYHF
jgi:outer membrane protein assembly factor BamA